MSILQTTDLKKYYGTEPNITKALDGDTADKKFMDESSASPLSALRMAGFLSKGALTMNDILFSKNNKISDYLEFCRVLAYYVIVIWRKGGAGYAIYDVL